MASYLLEVPVDGGLPVFVSMVGDENDDRIVPTSRTGDTVVKAARSLQDNLEPLTAIAHALGDRLRKAVPRPDETTMEFGFDIRAEGGIVILGAKTGAAFKVTMTWRTSAAPDTDS